MLLAPGRVNTLASAASVNARGEWRTVAPSGTNEEDQGHNLAMIDSSGAAPVQPWYSSPRPRPGHEHHAIEQLNSPAAVDKAEGP